MSQEKGNEDLRTQDLTNIEKLLKELAINVAKLNENILKTTKTYNSSSDAVAAHSEQTKKNKLEVQQAYFDNLKEMAKYRKALKESGSQFNFLTGLITRGASGLQVLSKVAGKANDMANSFDTLKSAQKELADMNEEFAKRMEKAGKTGDPLTQVATEKERAQHGKLSATVEKGEGKDDSKTGAFFSFGKKFFEKHAVGLAIGAGAAGTLLKVLKMAFDASPMFQQMKKLLQFGVMMVLRPIGDFFGFLFRPILIMLLRKFIIPWYTKMYPQMMKWGTEIGTKLAGALSALMSGDIGGAFAALWGDVDWGKIIWDAVRLMSPAIAAADFIAGLFGVGDNTWTNEWGRKVGTWFSDGLAEATPEWNKFWTETWTWFSGGIKEISDSWNSLWTSVFIWFWTGIRDIEDSWNKLWDGVYGWFTKGISGITTHWDNFWDHIWSWLTGGTSNDKKEEKKQDDGWTNWLSWADGGHITEPIRGVGRSGQKYLMGESGNETVVPDDELGSLGGGGITINIQNMSGSQQDLNNLRQTILEVVQESNSRRGRT